jgi:hypothetical protein
VPEGPATTPCCSASALSDVGAAGELLGGTGALLDDSAGLDGLDDVVGAAEVVGGADELSAEDGAELCPPSLGAALVLGGAAVVAPPSSVGSPGGE